jgi:hypothetical protein
VEKHGRIRQATDDCIIRRMRLACWITKATDIHSEYVILIALYTVAMVTRIASLLLYISLAVPRPRDESTFNPQAAR